VKAIRSRLTYANVMSTLAVFLVLGGGAVAAVKLGKNTVGTRQLKENAVTASKIKNGAITGAKLNLASLGTVPAATSATTATNATNAVNATNALNATNATNAKNAVTATSATTADSANTANSAATANNALSLGGVPASEYTRSECGSISGAVKGFATVNGPAVSKGSLSTAGVGVPYNCSGGEVLAGEILTGLYVVEFIGSPVAMAFVTPLNELASTFVSVENGGSGVFVVTLRNQAGTPVEGSFNIMTP
jgi:hypothetical protein